MDLEISQCYNFEHCHILLTLVLIFWLLVLMSQQHDTDHLRVPLSVEKDIFSCSVDFFECFSTGLCICIM